MTTVTIGNVDIEFQCNECKDARTVFWRDELGKLQSKLCGCATVAWLQTDVLRNSLIAAQQQYSIANFFHEFAWVNMAPEGGPIPWNFPSATYWAAEGDAKNLTFAPRVSGATPVLQMHRTAEGWTCPDWGVETGRQAWPTPVHALHGVVHAFEQELHAGSLSCPEVFLAPAAWNYSNNVWSLYGLVRLRRLAYPDNNGWEEESTLRPSRRYTYCLMGLWSLSAAVTAAVNRAFPHRKGTEK